MPDRETYIYSHYIGRLMHALGVWLSEKFSPFDITPQQARVVFFLSACDEREAILYPSDLEEKLALRGSSVTSLIDGLEKRGYLERRKGERDGRRRELRLTPKGYEVGGAFAGVFEEAESRITKNLSADEKKQLLSLLKKAAGNLEAARENQTKSEVN